MYAAFHLSYSQQVGMACYHITTAPFGCLHECQSFLIPIHASIKFDNLVLLFFSFFFFSKSNMFPKIILAIQLKSSYNCLTVTKLIRQYSKL